MKYGEAVEHGADATDVEPELRRSSVSTFERLQEEIIELEGIKRHLRRSVDQLRDEERVLTRRLDHRPRDTGTAAAAADLTTVTQ